MNFKYNNFIVAIKGSLNMRNFSYTYSKAYYAFFVTILVVQSSVGMQSLSVCLNCNIQICIGTWFSFIHMYAIQFTVRTFTIDLHAYV